MAIFSLIVVAYRKLLLTVVLCNPHLSMWFVLERVDCDAWFVGSVEKLMLDDEAASVPEPCND